MGNYGYKSQHLRSSFETNSSQTTYQIKRLIITTYKHTNTQTRIIAITMYTPYSRTRSQCPPTAKDSCPPSPDLALSQLMALLDPIIYGTPATTLTVPQVRRDHLRRTITPRFDVHEAATEYILEGEVPGLGDKSKLDIQFTDHKTLSVRGILEHTRAIATPTVTSSKVPREAASASSRSPNPTVENIQDESDTVSTMSADEFEVILMPSSEKADPVKPPSSPPAKEKSETTVENENPVSKNENSRVWVSERAFGSFQRTFSFPGPIDIDNVIASLDCGLLRIVVPKKTQNVAKKIVVG